MEDNKFGSNNVKEVPEYWDNDKEGVKALFGKSFVRDETNEIASYNRAELWRRFLGASKESIIGLEPVSIFLQISQA